MIAGGDHVIVTGEVTDLATARAPRWSSTAALPAAGLTPAGLVDPCAVEVGRPWSARRADGCHNPAYGDPSAAFQEPGWFTKHVFNRLSPAGKTGLSIAGSRVLEVQGRKSGEWRQTPVNPLDLRGQPLPGPAPREHPVGAEHAGERRRAASCAVATRGVHRVEVGDEEKTPSSAPTWRSGSGRSALSSKESAPTPATRTCGASPRPPRVPHLRVAALRKLEPVPCHLDEGGGRDLERSGRLPRRGRLLAVLQLTWATGRPDRGAELFFRGTMHSTKKVLGVDFNGIHAASGFLALPAWPSISCCGRSGPSTTRSTSRGCTLGGTRDRRSNLPTQPRLGLHLPQQLHNLKARPSLARCSRESHRGQPPEIRPGPRGLLVHEPAIADLGDESAAGAGGTQGQEEDHAAADGHDAHLTADDREGQRLLSLGREGFEVDVAQLTFGGAGSGALGEAARRRG